MKDNEQEKSEDPQHINVWWNIGMKVFLVAALVAAWFVLDWLMGGK